MLKCQKNAAWYPCMTYAETDTLRKKKELPGFVDCFFSSSTPFPLGIPVHLMVMLTFRAGNYLLYLSIVITIILLQNHSSINIHSRSQHTWQYQFERASGWARMEAETYIWQVHSWGLTRLSWMIAPRNWSMLQREKKEKLREGTFRSDACLLLLVRVGHRLWQQGWLIY